MVLENGFRSTAGLLMLLAFRLAVSPSSADDRAGDPKTTDAAAVAFFESEVRPLLVERCQSCHGGAKQKGGLRLDSRAALLAGGANGPAVVPGEPGDSLLIDAVNYGEIVQMPPKSKLGPREIATLTRWVELGAPWPAEPPPSTPASSRVKTFDLSERARHWSFQPIRDPAPPPVRDSHWAWSPIDRFVLVGLEARGLRPAPDADRRTWLRRVTFDLIGLPTTPDEIAAFLADETPGAEAAVIDRLLASPHYGERWGRHWLDLVRYAETAGHEFDYDAPDAYRYRDYIIRAFNADLPYDRLVVEHLAGDLLESPRRDPTEGFNESVLGTGFFFLGEGTHSPVDLPDDEALRIDNQIDVMSKAFLGLTVACARCHDHKFDPITTRDYYALAGFLKSSRHQHAFIDPPEQFAAPVAELESIRERLRALVSCRVGGAERNPPFRERMEIGGLRSAPPTLQRSSNPDSSSGGDTSVLFEDFNRPTYDGWFVTGPAFGSGPSRPGAFRIEADGVRAVPAGQAHSGLVSDRLQGVLRSATFPIRHRTIQYLASGRRGRINLVIDGFEKIKDPIYGGLTIAINAPEAPRWYVQDVGMWIGHRAYIELSDGATVDYTGSRARYGDGDGFLAVDEIRFSDRKSAPSPPLPTPARAVPLDPRAFAALLAEYRRVEATIPLPTLALAIADGTGEDDRVHLRGSTRSLGEAVPRRFLEVLAGPEPLAPARGSGRLELARRLTDPANPLLARVIVNRIWKHHFGEGLVRTPDDFGAMGQPPSHPELLDWLATRFRSQGWSIKALHREILNSHAYRMASRPEPEAERRDPDNRLLHRMSVRRLEAEAIRDAILAVSGRLDRRLYGPSVPPHLTPFMEGRGRPTRSGPLDGDGRRSLYLNVRRNFLTPMLLAFDFPAPATTIGRRNVSNVPAQALTLLNDPFVIEQARCWADRLLAEACESTDRRIDAAYLTAFARPPTDAERSAARAFLDERTAASDPRQAWADFAHVLLNVKGFVFVD